MHILVHLRRAPCMLAGHLAGPSRCKQKYMADKGVSLPKALYSHAQRRDKVALPGPIPAGSRAVIKLARKLL